MDKTDKSQSNLQEAHKKKRKPWANVPDFIEKSHKEDLSALAPNMPVIATVAVWQEEKITQEPRYAN